MKLSTRSRYAARALGELVKLGGDKAPVMMRKIAEGQDVSKRYLDNIFATLRLAGIIRTVRGAAGGYLLNRAPEDIKLLDVVEALDGKLTLVECVDDDYNCDHKETCATHLVWTKASRALRASLEEVSLADLAAMEFHECPPEE